MNPFFKDNNIAVVSGCNDNYIPYLAVLLKSLMQHFSEENNYDIILLEFGITQENRDKILRMASRESRHVSVRFYDVSEELKINTENWNIGRWSIELWITLLAPYILTNYAKVVYMDCDVINQSDIAQLYKEDIEHYLVGAVRLLGRSVWNYNGFMLEAAVTFRDNPPMEHISSYFNNGIMLLNLEEFRKTYSLEYITDFISKQNFRLLDQDCINVLCQGRVKNIDAGWNCYPYTKEEFANMMELCPKEWKEYFMEGYKDIKNIHYTTPQKPWFEMYGCYFESALYFWEAAAETEFYDQLLEGMSLYQEEKEIINKYIFRGWEELQKECCENKLLMYGCGKRGREFMELYSDVFHLCGVIERDEGKWKEDGEIPIMGPDSLKRYSKKTCIVISVDDYSEIVCMLYKKGFQNLFMYRCMRREESFLWKTEKKDVKSMSLAYGTFEDKKSQKIYSALIQKRNHIYEDKNLKCLDIYEGNAYFRNDFYELGEAEVYLDIGNLSDCTVKYFKRFVNNRFKSIISIEDDKWSEKKRISNIEERKITFIKANVHNAMEFLVEAQKMIRKYRPKLAIGVSNRYADLWEVPVFLKALVPEYSLYLRHHSVNLALTVLYASAEGKKNGNN